MDLELAPEAMDGAPAAGGEDDPVTGDQDVIETDTTEGTDGTVETDVDPVETSADAADLEIE